MKSAHASGFSYSCASILGLSSGCLAGCKIPRNIPVRQSRRHELAPISADDATTAGGIQVPGQGSSRVSKAQILTTSAPPPSSSQVPPPSLGRPPLLLGVLWVSWLVTRKLVQALGRQSGLAGMQSSGSKADDSSSNSGSSGGVEGSAGALKGGEFEAGGRSGPIAGDEAEMMEGAGYAEGAEQGDLGRVMICARLPAPVTSSEAYAAAFFDVLEAWSGGPFGPFPGGLLFVFPNALLVCIEAGNHQLMALLRASLADAEWREQHGVLEARVVSFVLDVQDRAFKDSWHCAFVQGGRDNRSMLGVRKAGLKGTSMRLGMGAFAGSAGGAAGVLQGEAEWANKVQELEHFVLRVASAKLQYLNQAMAASALRDPAAFFGHSLFPSQSTILELADNELGPDALNFVNIFDVDYAKWKDLAIQSSQGLESASSNPDLVRLACFYQAHAVREEAQQASVNASTSSPLARFYPRNKKS
mmetsp:Transcript_23699/g.65183  ORF Transcript_23699/g.65183 Transcript_23699/m.65183 type:complete len:473 (+) Transcript_23699:81-1499(+)